MESLKLPIYLNELKIFDKLPEILDSICKSTVTMVHAGTGGGKTVGIPRAVIEAFHNNMIEGYDKIIVSVPTVINVIYQYNYACKKNPRIKHLIGKACGGNKSANFDKAKMIYATTQTVVNHLKYLYNSSPRQLNRLVIMIDEAHYPSRENYMVHAFCNWLITKGFSLKIIIATATPSGHNFTELNKATEITLKCTQYPVTVTWHTGTIIERINKETILKAIIRKVAEVVKIHETGDILIFTSGENEIGELLKDLSSIYRDYEIFPLYSSLPEEEMEAVNKPISKRKIVIATNVAESGITIDGIAIVIDSLTHKKMSIKNNIRIIEEVPISQASSMQRRGRAGRTCPGYYFPLCTELYFETLPKYIENEFGLLPKHIPIINFLASNLPANEILLIPEDEYSVLLKELVSMKLIEETENNYKVTNLGKEVSKYPLSIKLTSVLLNAIEQFKIRDEDGNIIIENVHQQLHAIIAVSLIDAKISCPRIFWTPRGQDLEDILEDLREFFSAPNDITVLVKIFCEMMINCLDNRTKKVNYRKWCKDNHVSQKFIEMSYRLFKQVWYIVFGNAPLNRENFRHVLDNCELYSDGIIELFSAVYPDRVFTLIDEQNKVYKGENYVCYIDRNSISTMWKPKRPGKIIALGETMIQKPFRQTYFLSICFPVNKKKIKKKISLFLK